MFKPRAFLFDLDGTLFDTAPDLRQALNQVLNQHGRPEVSLQAIRPFISTGAKGMLSQVFNIDRLHPGMKALEEDCIAAYRECLTDQTTLFPGMNELLAELDHHKIPWGVVTNKPYTLSESIMRHFNLFERSRCLVAGDTLPTRKPDPAPLRYAAELLGTPETTCVYVGDARSDIQAARAAKMFSIAAAYGYLPRGESAENWKADKIITSPYELQPLSKQ